MPRKPKKTIPDLKLEAEMHADFKVYHSGHNQPNERPGYWKGRRDSFIISNLYPVM